MSRTRTATAALLALPLAAAGLLGAATAPAEAATARPAPSLTCRGQGVDPDALVRARTEAVIDAPLSTVWKLQTEVERWPDWQTHVTSMDRLGHGPFRPGSAFRWTTPV
ncbi:polyketide cyclase /reductase, partial [Streptomyces sp. ID01-9D]|nr:polyketide cyclase /reductase [Streptomyces sp. ID01-9D]